jgi:hypothetical protein
MHETKYLDDALLAYMVKYYSGTDAQSVYFQSMSEPRNALSWHRYLVTLHPNDYLDEFANQVGGPAWFVFDKPRRTATQLAAKAKEFVRGFYDFVEKLQPQATWSVLEEIKRRKNERTAKVFEISGRLQNQESRRILSPDDQAGN